MTQCLTRACWATVSWSGNWGRSIWAIWPWAGSGIARHRACNTSTELAVHLKCGTIQNHGAVVQFATSLWSCSQVTTYTRWEMRNVLGCGFQCCYTYMYMIVLIMTVSWLCDGACREGCYHFEVRSCPTVYRIDVTHTTLCGLQSTSINNIHTFYFTTASSSSSQLVGSSKYKYNARQVAEVFCSKALKTVADIRLLTETNGTAVTRILLSQCPSCWTFGNKASNCSARIYQIGNYESMQKESYMLQ